jgi:hypothetical protein
VKKRTRLPSSKGKEKEEGGTEGMDGLANAAFDQSMPGSVSLVIFFSLHGQLSWVYVYVSEDSTLMIF